MANLSSTRIFGDGTVERSLYVKQRLGVGVGNPSERIEVGGESYPQIRFDTSDGNSTVWDVGFAGDYAFQIRNQNTSDTHVTVNPGGNVGINENSPSYKLDVNGDTNIQGTLRNNGSDVYARTDQFERITSRWEWDTNDANTAEVTWDKPHSVSGTGLIFDFDRRGGTKHQLRMTNGDHLQFRETNNNNTNLYLERGSGNVGIGTTSPQGPLEVVGPKNQITVDHTDGWSIIQMIDDLGNDWNLEAGRNSGTFGIYNGGGQIITLDDSKKVGISTTSPNHKLHVEGEFYTNTLIGVGRVNNYAQINIDSNASSNTDINFLWTDAGTAEWDIFADGGNNYDLNINDKSGSGGKMVTFQHGGNVGIGTTSPVEKLEVNGSIFAKGEQQFIGIDARDEVRLGFIKQFGFGPKIGAEKGSDITLGHLDTTNLRSFTDSTNWSPRLTIDTNGNVGIGTTSPDAKLDVNGTIYADGDVIAYYSSDRRLKDNATQIQNPMSKIENFTGVGFDWKEEASRDGSGFGIFAQDAKKIDERLVRKQGDGYLGVDYQQLHGIEIEALKQVNEKVEENQSEIQRLKQRIAKLESNDNAI